MKINASIVLILIETFLRVNGCKMTIKDADECGHKGMIFGNRNTIIPSNEEELDRQCAIMAETSKCMTEFVNECLTGFTKTAFTVGMNNMKKHTEKRCKEPKERAEFLSHLKCLLPPGNMEPFHICMDKDLVMMEKMKAFPVKDRMSAGCCLHLVVRDCFRKQSKALCSDDTSDYWDAMFDEMEGDTKAIRCANFATLDKCDQNLDPKLWGDMKEVAASDDASVLAQNHKFGSGIAIAIDLMKDMKM